MKISKKLQNAINVLTIDELKFCATQYENTTNNENSISVAIAIQDRLIKLIGA